jgi:hypothetical protein
MLDKWHYFSWTPPRNVQPADFVKRYKQLCQLATSLFKKFDPCQIKDGKCLRGRFCCDGCEYLSPTGCTTEAIWCKLWLCDDPRYFDEEFTQRLKDYKDMAQELCMGRGGRYGLDTYIKGFWGAKEYEQWKTTGIFTIKASSLSES